MKGIKSGKAVGGRIKQRRKELGISQEKLAEALDVSYQQIQRYEKGANLLNTDKLQQLSGILAVPVGYFFEEHDRAREGEVFYTSTKEVKLMRLFSNVDERYEKSLLQFMKLAQKGR